MASSFDAPKISYALEKFGDFIRGSGTGSLPVWSDAGSKVIIDCLRNFRELLCAHGSADEAEYLVDPAIYAACELQSFVTGDRSDIANRTAALVYRDFLEMRIAALQKMDEEWGRP